MSPTACMPKVTLKSSCLNSCCHRNKLSERISGTGKTTGTVTMPLKGSTDFPLISICNSKRNCGIKVSDPAREDPGKTQKHYFGWSVSFKQCTEACKRSSEGNVPCKGLEGFTGSKAEAENEEKLGMFTAEGTTLRMKREGKQQWYCNNIGIPSMSVPLLTQYQTSIWCHLIKTPVPGHDIQHHESNETSANSYNSQTKQA